MMRKINRLVALPLAALILGLGACNNANQEVQEEQASVGQTPVNEEQASVEQTTLAPSPEETRRAMTVSEAPNPDWAKNSVLYEVNIRQYTKEGTFKAFEEHLPRLKELGVDILWLMPIHPISKEKRNGTLGSYYAVQDYKGINSEFGTAEEFKSLVDKAHNMGFKVIIDWVANHTGWDHAWITSHPDWYTKDIEGNMTCPIGSNWADVADLNYESLDMQVAMIDAMKYWITEFDIDGYRADYANGVPTAFWEKARGELEKVKPIYMLAEDDKVFGLLDQAFNSNYGWDLYHLMNEIAKGEKSAKDVLTYVLRMEKLYPEGTYPLQFISNHDENSWTGTEYERLGPAVKAMTTLAFTVPGMPLIYSGQEAGLKERLLFFDKDEISWDDLTMQSFYQELIRLKKNNSALWNGKAGGVLNSFEIDDSHILAFERIVDDNSVVVVMNLSSGSVKGTVKVGASSGAYKIFPSQEAIDLKAEHSTQLGPWEYQIYTK